MIVHYVNKYVNNPTWNLANGADLIDRQET